MDKITIQELAVNFYVGVPDHERARAQRLLISIDLFTDCTACAAGDDLDKTIDYFAVVQQIKRFGEGRSWKLIETLASDIASMLLESFRPLRVAVEVRKFIVPDCRYIAVRVERETGRTQH